MPTDLTAADRAFVDTNIFAYAQDLRVPEKREKALTLLQELSDTRRMVISTQVMNELCAILLRGKAGTSATQEDLNSLLDEMEATAEVVTLTPAMTREALRAVFRYGMSWYDALIWAAAKTAGCAILYTEDYQAHRDIEGVRYINPFVEATGGLVGESSEA